MAAGTMSWGLIQDFLQKTWNVISNMSPTGLHAIYITVKCVCCSQVYKWSLELGIHLWQICRIQNNCQKCKKNKKKTAKDLKPTFGQWNSKLILKVSYDTKGHYKNSTILFHSVSVSVIAKKLKIKNFAKICTWLCLFLVESDGATNRWFEKWSGDFCLLNMITVLVINILNILFLISNIC